MTQASVRVLRDDDPQCSTLQAQGWAVVARSWAAALAASAVEVDRLRAMVGAVSSDLPAGVVRRLGDDDVPAVLALDRSTLDDYPGGAATAHAALTEETARPTELRRGVGVFDDDVLVAMTFTERTGDTVETDFTVVAATHRGHGLSTAVKAASVLDRLAFGRPPDAVHEFRTGGSDLNAASLRANARLGYVVDERWLTYAPPEAAR